MKILKEDIVTTIFLIGLLVATYVVITFSEDIKALMELL